MIWDELTTVQMARVDKKTPVLLVVAATEQHGPHLPLATDRLIGEHFARSLHHSMPKDVLVLPAIGVGCSGHHMDFSGSLTVSHETFIKQVGEIVEAVIAHGFTNILLLNSHGGNQAVAQTLVEKLGMAHPKINMVLGTWWKMAGESLKPLNESGPGGTGHAGEFETSLMLLIAPKLVHMERLEKGKHNATFPWAEGDMLNAPSISYFRTLKEISANGVFGDPTLATKEKGKQITRLVVDKLGQLIGDLKSASLK